MKKLVKNIEHQAQVVVALLAEKKMKISFAESCTGGLVSSYLTDVSGSSKVFTESYITYSNESKFRILTVNPATLSIKGAVSEETVGEMLDGLLAVTDSDIVGAISGIAGPSGGTAEKPVGTVYIGVCIRDKRDLRSISKYSFEHEFTLTPKESFPIRNKIKLLSVEKIFSTIINLVSEL